MLLEDFTNALDELGIAHKESGQSLKIQNCPCCGGNNFKVHIRLERPSEDDVFFGRCYSGSCGENFSSFKYLLEAGMEYQDVMHVHGKDPHKALMELANVDNLLELASKNANAPKKMVNLSDLEVEVSKFFKISDWIDHPASIYAISRGVKPAHYDNVLIDVDANAVVFLIRENGNVVGYQKRFVRPATPSFKTQTYKNFEKTKHIMEFPNIGKKILVCEGPFTAIAGWSYGYHSVCTLGSGVSQAQIDLIVEMSKRLNVGVVVAFDNDEAGQKGYEIIRNGLFWKDRTCSRVEMSGMPKGFDLADAWAKSMEINEILDNWSGPAIKELRF
jgi:hypothetical protein